MYKDLSADIKRDMEQSFCIRNTLRWMNINLNGTFNKYFQMFSEEIGLNIDELVKHSEYLSNFNSTYVMGKFKRRAEIINMPAQEYIDTCSSQLIPHFVR